MRGASAGPLYRQIEEDLRARIRAGEFAPGVALPTEEQIGQQYGVSRITVRRAIEDMARDLIVVRRHGVGTFVAESDHVLQSIRLRGYLDEVLTLDRHLEFSPVEMGDAALPADVADILSVAAGTEAPFAQAVALLEGAPFMVGNCWFLPGRVPKLRATDFKGREQPILRVLTRAGIGIERGEQVIQAAAAPRGVARVLAIEPGRPLLEVFRTYFAVGGTAVAVIRGWYHPTNYRMTADLFPRGRPAAERRVPPWGQRSR